MSGFTIAEIEPRLFSFNNPFGACPVCDGLGTEQKIDPNLIVSDVTLSLRDGAIVPWSKTSAPYYQQTLQAVVKHFGASTGRPGKTCRRRCRTRCSTAPARRAIQFVYDDGLRTYKTTKPFEGVIGNLERRYKETESAGMREEIEKYMSSAPCVACNGYRLKPEALAVKIDGLHIGQVSEKSIRAAAAWFEELPAKLTRDAEPDRRAHLQGDPRAAGLPQRCRARLPDAGAQLGLAVGRREPAHPARDRRSARG